MPWSDLIPGRRAKREEALRAEARMEVRSALDNIESTILQELVAGSKSKSGIKVTPLTAMGVPTVFACVRRISNTISTLPIHLMRSRNGFSERVEANPLYPLLRYSPNPDMSVVDFVDAVQSQATLRQNGYAVINFDAVGRPAEIVPVDNVNKVRIERAKSGELIYFVDNKQFSAREILHIRAHSKNGINGQDIVSLQGDVIGLALALVDNASDFFANGSRPSGVFKHPSKLKDESYARLKKSLENKYSGVGNQYKTMLLEEGLEYVNIRHSNTDSQMVEARKEQNYDIARIFGVPPHKVGIMDKSSFNNIEAQNGEYAVDTILPWVIRWELELTRKLLTPRQIAQGFHYKINMDALVRPHLKERYEAHEIAIRSGWRNKDETREIEGLPPLPDGLGKIYVESQNYKPVGQETEALNAGGETDED